MNAFSASDPRVGAGRTIRELHAAHHDDEATDAHELVTFCHKLAHVFDPTLFAIFRDQLPAMLAARHRSDTQVESFPALPTSGAFSAVKSRRRRPVLAVA